MDRPNNTKQIIITIIVVVVIVICLILGIRLILSVIKNGLGTRNQGFSQPTESQKVTINENLERIETIKEPKEKYSGTIKFTATVEKIIGVRAFTVKNAALWKDEFLIITEDGIAPIGAKTAAEYLIKPGDRLMVTGNLIEFDQSSLKGSSKDAQTVNLNTWFGKPAVYARNLSRIVN